MISPRRCNADAPPSPAASLSPIEVQRVLPDQRVPARDVLAVEEPLEIRVLYSVKNRRRQRTIAVTMRTPGADRELAAGFLFTEGIVQSQRDILVVQPCRGGNVVRVHLRDNVQLDRKKLKRHFYMTSSCGICGKASIDAIEVCPARSIEPDRPVVSRNVIHQLPAKLRAVQAIFEQTGGLHASALFDAHGELLCLCEDVGRHNALDKLIGHQLLRKRIPLSNAILLVSGRASFELVQKAAVAGIPILAAIGAPSSLACELAKERGMTLLGFVRQDRFNIYCGNQRIH